MKNFHITKAYRRTRQSRATDAGVRKRIRFVPLLLLIAISSTQAEQCHPGMDGLCKIVVEDTLPSGKTLQLEITEAPVKVENSMSEEPTGYWGANGKYPATYINKLSLVIENSKMSIPLKLYTDLGNLYFAEVKENEHAIVLIVKGGEALASYYATFVFVDYRIRKRTVRSDQSPDQLWEKNLFP